MKPPDFEIGETVYYRHDDGCQTQHTVKYPPWQLGHGAWVIGLSGVAGGVAVERVTKQPCKEHRP